MKKINFLLLLIFVSLVYQGCNPRFLIGTHYLLIVDGEAGVEVEYSYATEYNNGASTTATESAIIPFAKYIVITGDVEESALVGKSLALSYDQDKEVRAFLAKKTLSDTSGIYYKGVFLDSDNISEFMDLYDYDEKRAADSTITESDISFKLKDYFYTNSGAGSSLTLSFY